MKQVHTLVGGHWRRHWCFSFLGQHVFVDTWKVIDAVAFQILILRNLIHNNFRLQSSETDESKKTCWMNALEISWQNIQDCNFLSILVTHSPRVHKTMPAERSFRLISLGGEGLQGPESEEIAIFPDAWPWVMRSVVEARTSSEGNIAEIEITSDLTCFFMLEKSAALFDQGLWALHQSWCLSQFLLSVRNRVL